MRNLIVFVSRWPGGSTLTGLTGTSSAAGDSAPNRASREGQVDLT